jgi:site-specific recombinase XerD
MQADLGLAPNTLDAYGRALHDYLTFCRQHAIAAEAAQKEHVAAYVHDLASRPRGRGTSRHAPAPPGLANATLQLYLTAVRLYYDYLMEKEVRATNPVGHGRYTPGNAFGGQRERGLLPHFHKLPWIPNEEQWRAVLEVVREESLRNQVMFLVAYEGALRREELVSLESGDIDPAYRQLTIRGDATKTHQGRVVFYSEYTSQLLGAYLRRRRTVSAARGRVFLSESHRNRGHALGADMWSAIVERVAARAGVPRFTTHTARHLRLTHLARAGWELHELATYAGHRTPQTTLLYIHLSGRDLADKLARSMAGMDHWLAGVITPAGAQERGVTRAAHDREHHEQDPQGTRPCSF